MQHLSAETMQNAIAQWYKQISDNKQKRIKQVLAQRTAHVTVVLEDTFQPFNASAILRTAEIYGLQQVHVIEGRNSFRPSVGISRGAVKWLELNRYKTPQEAIEKLRSKGYTIAATTFDVHSIPLAQIPVDKKVAVLFGNELVGLTQEAIAYADFTTHIPMFGFTQSFNISVAVALYLHHITSQLRQSTIPWQLSQEEQLLLEYQWCKKLVERR